MRSLDSGLDVIDKLLIDGRSVWNGGNAYYLPVSGSDPYVCLAMIRERLAEALIAQQREWEQANGFGVAATAR